MNDDAGIEVRQIEANAMRATLAMRLTTDAEPAVANQVYRGEVYGPLASDRTTLPASYRIPELRAGEEVQVVVTDPCFWSPDAPLEYEILLSSVDEGAVGGQTLRRTIRLLPRSELA